MHRLKRWISWRLYKGSPTHRDRAHLNGCYQSVLLHLKTMCKVLGKEVARGRQRFSMENLVSRKEWCGLDEVYAAVAQELPHYNRILKAAADGQRLTLAERGLALQFILSAFFKYCCPARPSFYENINLDDWIKALTDPQRMLRSRCFKTGVCVCVCVLLPLCFTFVHSFVLLHLSCEFTYMPCIACSCRVWRASNSGPP